MVDEGAVTPTVLPKIDFYFVLQTAASDISNQHTYIAFIHSQKLNTKLIPPFTKLIFYHHIFTFPPRKIPTMVTQVFSSIDARQGPSIDSNWGNQAVRQIQLQKAVGQRGRGVIRPIGPNFFALVFCPQIYRKYIGLGATLGEIKSLEM